MEPQSSWSRSGLVAPFQCLSARSFSRQAHDYFLVLDLEATCTKRRDLFPVEIIEVAALLLDGHSLRELGCFQSFVRPTEHPRLDPFCVELTGIEQGQVDTAPLLSEVLPALQAWLGGLGALRGGVSLLPVTWTDWDLKVCLETECEWRKLPRPPFLRRWCNLKQLYTSRYRRTHNLRKCVEAVGLTWQGRQHSGLDDTRNTAALAARMVRDGCVLRVTDSFKEPPPPPPPPPAPPSAQPPAQPPAAPQASTQEEHGSQQPGSQELASQGQASQGKQQQSLPGLRGAGGEAGGGGGGGRPGARSGGALRQTVLTLSAAAPPAAATAAATAGDAAAGPRAGGDGAGGEGPASAAAVVVTAAAAELPLYDSAGRWLGRCRCGVAAHFRTTKKPGANLGRQFYSCGRWTISDRSRQCDFFAWADQLELAAGAGAGGGGGGGGSGTARPAGSRSGVKRRR